MAALPVFTVMPSTSCVDTHSAPATISTLRMIFKGGSFHDRKSGCQAAETDKHARPALRPASLPAARGAPPMTRIADT
ncbi:hypothetical protein Pph01_50880 [Planotetraspora phitsanulokensis]|uniref:Uncharacterized protein n=1 Tax=Planotetraspora phitsanulokensis TaxID=575192 RepID=A0A8J3XGE7_9ACTN|nr:hypothetical protein Pph01_50880 [Planotetraspora phitsanulokensis]